MKLIDWVLSIKKSSPPQLKGDSRLADSYRNHLRAEEGLPPQARAWFVDTNGARTMHEIDVQHDGTPHSEISTVQHAEEFETKKDYVYAHYDKHGYLIYHQK